MGRAFYATTTVKAFLVVCVWETEEKEGVKAIVWFSIKF